MALSKVDYNSINVTPAASKALKWNSDADGFETGDVGGSMVLLATETASSSNDISFTSSIDSTYKEYIFKFYDIHASNSDAHFSFQVETGTNSDYNQTITSTLFYANQTESATETAVQYSAGSDLAQSTNFQRLALSLGTDNDQSGSGELHLYDPSNTTFVKHFIGTSNSYTHDDYTRNSYIAGYINDTTAITRVQFKMSAGTIDAGTIKMYGVS